MIIIFRIEFGLRCVKNESCSKQDEEL